MLTPEQNEVARHKGSPARVLAGAGSGKSTTLAHRIKCLIDGGEDPSKILTVMFNTDAAESFRHKLKKLLQKSPPVYTFHALGSQFLLQKLIAENLLPKARLVTSEWEFKKFAVQVLGNFLDRKQAYSKVFEFMRFVDLAKSTLKKPSDVFREYNFSIENTFFIDVFKHFEKKRKETNIRFFADLIYDPVLYLHSNKDKAHLVQNHFTQIQIDEYQDISDIQQQMMKIIAGNTAEVMVVGDDNQCIYSWRGARPYYIIEGFAKDFPNTKTFFLSQTFRNGHSISMAANYVIKNNTNRAARINTSATNTPKTRLLLDSEAPGQRSVSLHIKKYIEKSPNKLTDIAVLVRAYQHAVPIEIGFLEDGIPYRIEGGEPLFETPDIGAVVSALYLMSQQLFTFDPLEINSSIYRFIKHPYLIPDPEQFNLMYAEIQKDPRSTPTILDDMQFRVKESFSKQRLQKRSMAWRNFESWRGNDPYDAIQYALEQMGINHDIEFNSKNEEEKEAKRERYNAFSSYARHTKMSLKEFVDHIRYLLGKSKDKTSTDEYVLITSIHRSKGLEWPFVIMPGLVEGKFPHVGRDGVISKEELEDERRLFYVGMTRAIKQLVLIAPNDKRLHTHLQAGCDKPHEMIEPGDGVASRFLYETNAYLCQVADKILQGDEQVLSVVASPGMAREYVQRVKEMCV